MKVGNLRVWPSAKLRASWKTGRRNRSLELLQPKHWRVDGKIGYARLVIEDGGLIKGEVSPNKISLPRDMPIRPTTNPKDDKPKVKNSEPIKDDVAAA